LKLHLGYDSVPSRAKPMSWHSESLYFLCELVFTRDCPACRSYMGFLSTAYSQPSKLSIALQALALHIPPWIIAFAEHAPLKRLRVLNTAKATSLAFARKLIQETRSQPEGLVDRHILSILGAQVFLNYFRPSSHLMMLLMQQELATLLQEESSRG
jgi:hypothetical protein